MILKILENFLIRRFVCNVPSNQLNKIFHKLYHDVCNELEQREHKNFWFTAAVILYTKNYPNDTVFKKQFASLKLVKNTKNDIRKRILEIYLIIRSCTRLVLNFRYGQGIVSVLFPNYHLILFSSCRRVFAA